MNLPANIQQKIKVCGVSGCWIWMGCKDRHGYGQLRRPKGTMSVAHKIIYELFNGEVPKGYELDHFVCSRRDCVNPDHLRAVSHKENLLRSTTSLNAVNAAKTECQECGGPYAFKKSGYRFCRPCTLTKQRAKYYAMKQNILGEKNP